MTAGGGTTTHMGWRCSMEDEATLLVTTFNVPYDAEWHVEVQCEHWAAPLTSVCRDDWLAMQLPRTDRPRQMKLRACLGNDDWTPWKLVAGSTELQAPQMVGLDELKVVFNRFDRNRSGRLDFRELRSAVMCITGLDATFDAVGRLLTKYDQELQAGDVNSMEFPEWVDLVVALRRAQLEFVQGALVTLRAECAAHKSALGAREKEAATLRAELEVLKAQASQALTLDELRAAFARADHNKSGKLSHRELRAALRNISGLDPSFDEAGKLLARFDKDGDGAMDFGEFVTLVAALRRAQLEFMRHEISSRRQEVAALRAALEAKERELGAARNAAAAETALRAEIQTLRTENAQLRSAKGGGGGGGGSASDAEVAALRAENAQLRAELSKRGGGAVPPSQPVRASVAAGVAQSTDELRALFDRFDANRSGRLDLSELRNALQQLPGLPPPEQARELLARFDRGRTGLMEFDEFVEMVGALRRAHLQQLPAAPSALRDPPAPQYQHQHQHQYQYQYQKPPPSAPSTTTPYYGDGVDSHGDGVRQEYRPPAARQQQQQQQQQEYGDGMPPSGPPSGSGPSRRGPAAPAPPRVQTPEAELMRLFDRFDTNRSGRLDLNELRNALQQIPGLPPPERARPVVDGYQAGRLLDAREFVQLVRQLQGAAQPPAAAAAAAAAAAQPAASRPQQKGGSSADSHQPARRARPDDRAKSQRDQQGSGRRLPSGMLQ